jgi:hypothetical protein
MSADAHRYSASALSDKATRRMFRQARQEGEARSGTEADVDRIVSVRLTRANRRTERLMRRVDALEVRVKELEDKLGGVEEKQPKRGRFRRRRDAAAPKHDDPTIEGARLIASQMLESGSSRDEVAAHLHEAFELADPERVVDEVADGEAR